MRVPGWLVPVLVLLATLAGIGGARFLAAPSYTRDFAAAVTGRPETVRLVVRGLRCVDTARRLGGQLEEVPGVLRYVAYASRNEAHVTFDGAATGPAALREAIEAPVVDPESGDIEFGVFAVVSVDGRRMR
jgi:copper chaperone CopZ